MKQLKDKLNGYQMNLFSEGRALHICTGLEIDAKVISEVLGAPQILNENLNNLLINVLPMEKKAYFLPLRS